MFRSGELQNGVVVSEAAVPSRLISSVLISSRTLQGILAVLFLLWTTVAAQSFPLVRLNVSGSQRYTPQALAAALNLRTGQQTSQKQLEAAAARLTNSGLFSNVEFRFGWAGDGAVVNFDLRDNTNLVPVDFENFVWFSPNDLTGAIKQRLPLFTGVVPLSGDFNQQIIGALNAILKAREIDGNVVQVPHGPANGAPYAMFYRVEDHQITTTCCDFPGAVDADPIDLGEVARYVTNSRYEKSVINSFIRTRLKEIYNSRGYLGAKSADPKIKVTSHDLRHTAISLTVAVTEGPRYKLAGIQWSGNQAFPSAELTDVLKPAIGEPVNLARLQEKLNSVHELYASCGYLRATFELIPDLSANSTAKLSVNVHEGEQFRTGKVLFSGLDPSFADKVLNAWTMKVGEIYNASYPAQFMNNELNKLVPENLQWDWTRREDVRADSRTVDLYLNVTFKPRTR